MQYHTRSTIIGLALLASAGASFADVGADRASVLFNTCAKPDWPKASLRNEEQGTVTLSFRIEADGKVSDSKILKSSGFTALDMAARDGIMRCTFKPAKVDGKPEAAWMTMQYVWTLENAKPASPEAWRLAKEGAARGDAQAQFDLAKLHMNAGSTKPDLTEPIRLLKLAAEQNHPGAQSALGVLSMTGEAGGPTDPAAAADLLGKAAAQGDALGQHMLALLTMHGSGVARDRDAAIGWLRKSHAQKYDASSAILGGALVERAATPADIAEGLTILRAAAEKHDNGALFMLGRLSETGRHVPQDLVQAAAYYEKAAAMGSRQAPGALAKLRARKAP